MKESTRLTSLSLLPCSDSSSSDILGGIEVVTYFVGVPCSCFGAVEEEGDGGSRLREDSRRREEERRFKVDCDLDWKTARSS